MILQPSAATPLSIGRVLASSLAGRGLEDFEKLLVERLSMHDGIALSSLMRNTFAAVAAVRRRCPPGATIILPRYSCPSFIHGIQAAGMPYKYCDTDALTLSVRAEELERVADGSVGAVLIPNLFGLSADMPAIASLCHSKKWLLIEGADYSLGGTFAGQALGSFGDYAILNFQEGKALPIGGGMALSREAGDFAGFRNGKSASSVVAFTRSAAYTVLIHPVSYGLFSWTIARLGVAKKKFSMEDTIRETRSEYDYAVVSQRLNERISPFQGALGARLLGDLSRHVERRVQNAAGLEAALTETPAITMIRRHPSLDRCHYIRYPILVGNQRRDALCQHLIKQGFEASPMYVEHGMKVDPQQFPGAARICAELLTLPCHPLMSTPDVLRLASTIRTFMTQH